MNSLKQAFDDFQVEAFRFERLPSYNMAREKETLNHYLRGVLLPAEDGEAWKNQFDPWHTRLRNCKAANKRIIRVRMINTALSPYLNWELEWCYPRNVRAGEEVSVISEETCKGLFDALPLDFWLFDTSHPFDMLYADDGAFLEGVPGRQPLEYYLSARDALLKNSQELTRYFSNQRQGRQF